LTDGLGYTRHVLFNTEKRVQETFNMGLWKHNFRGNTLVFAVTAASCQAFLLLGYDKGV